MEASNYEIPWTELCAFILENGNIRTMRGFCTHFTENVKTLLPYDQARIYFVNDNNAIYDTVLYGVNSKWMDLYFEYYSELEGGRYSLTKGLPKYINVNVRSFDWNKASIDEFIADYIKPQGIRHSLSVFFHDTDNSVKAICTFERTSHCGYTAKEITTVGILHAHLDNLYKNLLFVPEYRHTRFVAGAAEQALTQREREITLLVRKGAKPSSVARKLGISLPTVYRHIANIYKKLEISSMQELMLISEV
jgi:DNA-binding CsgD family transcriptional regulator